MPLQNRVTPSGDIISSSQRGEFMGNRGGRIHDPSIKQLLPKKRWASKQWICCELNFKDRKRTVMGPGYTELFFLDEVTALAAGHRPCFECRRSDALAFAQAWQKAKRKTKRPTAPQLDDWLHRERLSDGQKSVHRVFWNALPNGAVIAHQGEAIAKFEQQPILWAESGYRSTTIDPEVFEKRLVSCLTAPAILQVLKAGYAPKWHPSAEALFQ